MTDLRTPTPREVRAQIRGWRRGRAELRFWELFGDIYIAVFTVAMVGAMAGGAVVNLRRLADLTCAERCSDVRGVAPWLFGLAVVIGTLGIARLLGPIFSPPAMNGWVLSTPVDRGGLLRPSLVRGVALALLLPVPLLIGPAVLGGLGPAEAAAYVAVGAATSVAALALAALSQIRASAPARVATWTLATALWVLLSLTATGRWTYTPPPAAVAAGVAVAAVVAGVLVLLAARAVALVSRRQLAQNEYLSPSLSGALASLDLGLMFDVLLARRWGRAASVRSRRGGPRGWWALVARDARRALRSPQPWLVLAGMTLLPYAAAEASAGRVTAVLVALGGLLCGPAMSAGLRVVARNNSIVSHLPFRRREVLLAHLVVPGAGLLGYALATTWALPGHDPWLALACGVSAIAATARWVTAASPDFARPLVSTPAGGVPPGMFGSLFRGFDIWLLTSLPLLFDSPWAVAVSLGLSAVTISVVTDPPTRPR